MAGGLLSEDKQSSSPGKRRRERWGQRKSGPLGTSRCNNLDGGYPAVMTSTPSLGQPPSHEGGCKLLVGSNGIFRWTIREHASTPALGLP